MQAVCPIGTPEAGAKHPVHVLELRSVFGTGGGPEKTILLGAARSDPARVRVTVCYIRDDRDPAFGVHEKGLRLGDDYVEIRERRSLDARIWPELRDLVRRRRIQIVHGHDYKTNLLALLLARAEGIVPITTAHGWTGHSRMERYFYYPADKVIARWFPAVIAVSGEIRDELVRWWTPGDRVHVVLNGIDHQAFRRDPHRVRAARLQFGLSEDDIAVGSVGRLEPQKRFDVLIGACARLRSQHPRLRLLIAGEGSLRRDLESLIAAERLHDTCRLLGHCDDIVGLHHALDLFVQSSAYEGTPNVVLEAMALETPVVATAVGGTAELCRDGLDGLLVEPHSIDQLVDAMASALGDPAATGRRCRSARRRTEEDLSFAARMDAVERVYERITG